MLFLLLKISIICFSGFLIGCIIFYIGKFKKNPKKPLPEIKNNQNQKKNFFSYQNFKNNFGISLKNMSDNMLENTNSKKSVKSRLKISAIILFSVLIITKNIFISLLSALLLFWLIKFYFTQKIKNKMKIFDGQLIEALSAIANSIKSGQSFFQAFENTANDAKEPLKYYFNEAIKQIKLGQSIGKALDDASGKIASKDFKMAVTSINLARESGGNLSEILFRIVNTMRERKKIKGKIAALTAQGKTSGTIMAIVPFILLFILYLIEPGMMGLLFTTLPGNAMLFIAVIMICIGMFFVNKIVDIDI